ncbi:unnamed protein product [Mytilus coruscus]|uniref:Uncharacterized protein n=1 Tax=Mytilus coruscus TaxID=42192 RepID=A0A6J8AB63_MYTCO|nr:unnamed protein product [Mytilus coruscus]
MFKYGQKPYKHYLNKFQETPMDVKIAGNFSTFGNSLGTFQKIANESKYPNKMDQSEFESLSMLAEKMKEDSVAKILPGFIRHIAILPPYVMYWTEAGVRIWHDMAKEGVGYFDATGTVVSPRGDGYKIYYYELVCHNPIPGESIIPVSIPHQLTSDRSMALIQAGLSEFNNENLNGFRSRTWRILSGNGFEGDFDGMFPHACLSHVMSSFYVLEHFKSNFDFGIYCFSVVLNSTDLTEASAMLKAVYYALLSKVLDKKTLFYLEQIQSSVAKLPKDITCLHVSEDLEVYQENHTTQQLFTEMLNPNQLTEEDFQNRSTNNEFSTWSEKILQDVKVKIKETIFVEVPGNNKHSKTLADKLHKLFIPTIALWSNMLLGDLSRHGNTNPYLLAKKKWMVQRANAKIEKKIPSS